MNVKDAENLVKNALRKSVNSSATLDELISAEFKAYNEPKLENHLDTPEDKKLKELCLTLPIERYGVNVPVEVINRLEQELEIITQNGYSRAYLLAYEVVNKCKELFAPYVARGCAGASLVAFILGITHTNPLPRHLYCSSCGFADFKVDKYYDGEDFLDGCGFDLVKTVCHKCGDEFDGDGHDIPFEVFAGLNGEKAPCFEIDVPEEHFDDINEFLLDLLSEEEFKKSIRHRRVRVISNPLMSLFNKLQESTMVSEDCIPIDGVDLYEVFWNGGYKAIPLFEDIPGEIVDGVSPSYFSDIVKLLGLVHGNLGKVDVYSPYSLYKAAPCIKDAIAHREDVMQTMMYYGFEREKAYHIMEAVRGGSKIRLSEGDIDEMKKKGIPDEYISYLKKIVYLSPRAHDTEFAIKLYKLMWYRQNFPEEYEHAINEYRDALESNKSKKG